jgi:AraC-like DNA-binding protein
MIEVSSPAPQEIDNHTAAVVRAIERMKGELASPLSLSDLATTGLFSPFHFHRMFRLATSMTPARFLAALRMAQARRLLLHSGLTVAAIGSRVGYTSIGTFTTQFTRLVGESPLRFRELVRGLGDRPIGETLAAAGFAAPVSTSHPYGLTVVELRREDDAGVPKSWCVAARSRAMWLDRTPAVGDYEARVLLIDARATPTDALVDDLAGSYLTGGATLRLSPCGQLGGPAEIALRPPRLTDPPVLSSAPLRWLADLASGEWDDGHDPLAGAAQAGDGLGTAHPQGPYWREPDTEPLSMQAAGAGYP